MSDGLADLDIRIHYEGPGEEILRGFVLPALRQSVRYDRVTGFFSVSSLLAIAYGIEDLWKRQGQMRLLIGVHDVPAELVEAATGERWGESVISVVRRRLLDGLSSIREELIRDRLATLAWMMKDQLLAVRVAVPTSPTRIGEAQGIFHSKRFIFQDAKGNVVSAVGSPNETVMGLGSNYEEITVHRSWTDKEGYVDTHVESFERLWRSEREGLLVRELDEGFADELLSQINRPIERIDTQTSPRRNLVGDILDAARESPVFGALNAGRAALFPHQERAMLDALSRWPLRVMFADEVGLGKTLEAGAAISYAIRHLGVRRVVVLAPKNVLRQWQDELEFHFSLEFWRYESGYRTFVSPKDEFQTLPPKARPIGPHTPALTLVSAQLARGARKAGHIFEKADPLPDMLVVDEAHAARVKPDLQGAMRPTLLWRMLDSIQAKIPHLIFLTATPLQIHWREYHALLALLGLPSAWRSPDEYERSLRILARGNREAELQTADLAMRLIDSTVRESGWAPEGLTEGERRILDVASDPKISNVRRALVGQTDWGDAFSLLVKTHPAHMLTIRNSRGALKALGYKFPKRNLHAPDLEVSEEISSFYSAVDEYLDSAYGEVEKAAYPDETYNIGFTKSSYHQRLASSLHAAGLTLTRRLARIEALRAGGAVVGLAAEEDDEEVVGLSRGPLDAKRRDHLERAATIEKGFIDDLLRRLRWIQDRDEEPDPKFRETLRLLDLHLGEDQILIFSRYTETLDGCLVAFHDHFGSVVPAHAMYTGNSTWIDAGAGPVPASKQTITRALEDGQINVVFCSEAASEGLNLQTARVLINIDVPWNPARLEQRVGRIDRLGQVAADVEIYNLWYPNSVEAKIYTRLLARKQLYELAVGEFPELISEAIRNELASRFERGARAVAEDPFQRLQELRKQHQHIAMQRVWKTNLEVDPASTSLRSRLADLLVGAVERIGGWTQKDDRGYRLVLPHDGNTFEFSVEPGTSRSLNLFHEALESMAEIDLRPGKDRELGELILILAGDVPVMFGVVVEGERYIVPPALLSDLLSAALGIRALVLDKLVVRRDQRDETWEGLGRLSRWIPNPDALRTPVDLEVPCPLIPSLGSLSTKTLGHIAVKRP